TREAGEDAGVRVEPAVVTARPCALLWVGGRDVEDGFRRRTRYEDPRDLPVRSGAGCPKIVVVRDAGPDVVDRFNDRDLVVGGGVAFDGVGVDTAQLLRDVQPSVRPELERGRVVDVRPLEAAGAERGRDLCARLRR